MSTTELVATLHGLTTSDPRRYAQAGFLRAAQLDIPTPAAINVIQSVRPTDQPLARLLNHRPTVHRLVTESKTLRTSSSSPSVAARARVRAARQLVGRVLGAGQFSWSERAILALLGLRLIDTGWPTVQVAPATLAVDLGMSERATQAALKRLVEKGAIRQTARRPGHAAVWKICKLVPADREGLVGMYDSVGALATGDPDPVSDAIRGVSSAEWGYADGRTWRHWVGSVAAAADRQMPCSRRVHLATLRELRRPVDLDAAEAAKTAAEEARRERAAARVAELERHRDQYKAMLGIIERMEAEKKARTATSPTDRDAWLDRFLGYLPTVDPEHLPPMKRALRSHWRRAGWPSEIVDDSLSRTVGAYGGALAWIDRLEAQAGPASDATTPTDRQAWVGRVMSAVTGVPDRARLATQVAFRAYLVRAGWPERTAGQVADRLLP